MHKSRYILLSNFLFIVEWYIAVYTHDAYVRPYVGDLLVAILIYCLVKCFTNYSIMSTCIGVLIYCYLVEITQYFHLIVRLGLNGSRAAHFILGSQFSWIDMLCYTAGIGIVFWIESHAVKKKAAAMHDHTTSTT